MDLTVLAASGLTGVIALAVQFVGQRATLATRREEREFEVRQAARREGADLYADVQALARAFDCSFEDLAALATDDVDELRAEARRVVHGLDRLTVLLPSKNASDWAAEVTGQFLELLDWLPSHPGCDDGTLAEGYDLRRHLIHAAFEWNDGSQSSQVIRFRDSLIKAGDGPQPARSGSLARRRRRIARRLSW
jgi:hypothetical protein